VSATEPVTSVLPGEPEPDAVPPDDEEPEDVDPEDVDPEADSEVDPELLVIGPDWMEVGALVASGPEEEVL
jgi:hypothetical protein